MSYPLLPITRQGQGVKGRGRKRNTASVQIKLATVKNVALLFRLVWTRGDLLVMVLISVYNIKIRDKLI
jgi:hypothetical protein